MLFLHGRDGCQLPAEVPSSTSVVSTWRALLRWLFAIHESWPEVVSARGSC